MSAAKCEHLNADDTFKGGFDGCVLHMQAECGGNHSEESAKKICGAIAANKAKDGTPPLAGSGPLMARLAVAAPDGGQDLKAGSVAEFMVMPAGTHTCWFMQGTAPVQRTVAVDRTAATALQEQLLAVNARGPQRAFFDFDHRDEAASAWPLGFLWRDQPAAGVYCRSELSQAGADAIKGKNYRAFSPVFFVTHTDPAKVICKEDAGLNMGSLVNDPAFHQIDPLWAKHTNPSSNQNPMKNLYDQALDTEMPAYQASQAACDTATHARAEALHAASQAAFGLAGDDEAADYHAAVAAFHNRCSQALVGKNATPRIGEMKGGDFVGHPFRGNQYTEGQGEGGEHNIASHKASVASHEAKESGSAKSHRAAQRAHAHAARMHEAEGNDEQADYHRSMASFHEKQAVKADKRELRQSAGETKNLKKVGAADATPLDTRHSPLSPISGSAEADPDRSKAVELLAASNGRSQNSMQEKLADLTAKLTKLDTDLQGLRAANAAGNAEAPQLLSAKLAERKNIEQSIRIAQLEGENEEKDKALKAQRGRAAQEAVADAIARGAIRSQDEPLQATWVKLCTDNVDMVETLKSMPGNSALAAGSITREATALAAANSGAALGRRDYQSLTASEGPDRLLKAYAALEAKNSHVRGFHPGAWQQRGELAKQMGALWARDIKPNWARFREMPLMGADFTSTDPLGLDLGTLSGTLVAQRTLELFKLSFPTISRVTTDFSDTPAQFKQTEATRVIIVPAVQSYNTASDGTGRPLGWNTVLPAQSRDVLITLDEHIGIPIVFDSNTLASTMRRLFDEQAPAAAYALAKYFVEKIYKLFTLANYNAYAAVNGVKVPVAYANYPVGLGDFARSSLTKVAAIFNPNEVPIHDRFVLLNSAYYEQLATDPSLVTFFAGQQAPEIVTENRLPTLAGFEPIEAPNLNAPAVTPNLTGMALQKAAVVAKTRLSNDYSQALPGSSYGSVTTVTDPDIGISVVLVQYVNHTGGYAEWRIQVMLGAAVGDNRGGLCITSQ